MSDVSDIELAEAKARWQAECVARPVPVSVRYDKLSGRIVVEFMNGSAFMVPARSLQFLDTATDEQLAEVELLGETGLHWESLDVDYSIAGVMNGVFGSATFMDAQRRGGKSRSAAKIAAARANGSKGGRPPKVARQTVDR